jgi:hypothetical protein
VQITSRNRIFTQFVVNSPLSNLKICDAVAVSVNLKVWLPSPLLLGMVVLFRAW